MPEPDGLPDVELLACPLTRQPLRLVRLDEAETMAGAHLARAGETRGSAVETREQMVLLRDDLTGAYPIVDGVPALMGPQLLSPSAEGLGMQVKQPDVYREAIEETPFYSEVAERESSDLSASSDVGILTAAAKLGTGERSAFPDPYWIWLDAVYDSRSQWDCLAHLAPIHNARVLQMGGRGRAVIRLLLAGASDGWLITPVMEEARLAVSLAGYFGFADRFWAMVAVAEEMPFVTGIFDGIYAGGCLHHTITSLSIPEAKRVLKPGGRFAASDPWRTPIYGIGTRIFGKRGREEVHCKPLDEERVRPLFESFRSAELRHYGALTRYPLLLLSKLGINPGLRTVWNIFRLDEAVGRLLPWFANVMGGSVALLARK